MPYAEVAVDAPGAERQTFTYLAPDDLGVGVGQSVRVPFGAQSRHGIVVSVAPDTALQTIRSVEAILDPEPLISELLIGLAEWIRLRYLATPFEAIKLMLPPASGRRRRTFFRISRREMHGSNRQFPIQTDLEQRILDVLGVRALEMESLSVQLDERVATVRAAIVALLRVGNIATEVVWDKPRIVTQYETRYRLAIDRSQVAEAVAQLRKIRAEKQADALEFLAMIQGPSGEISSPEAIRRSGVRAPSWNKVVQKGFVVSRQQEIRRSPVAERSVLTGATVSPQPRLTPNQSGALQTIVGAMRHPADQKGWAPHIFLLHGVTGSGKTEIYLRALEETIALGKRGIVLVPEIALTPQTIDRFSDRFPGRVAVLHSGLSLRDQYDEWRNIRDGRFDVVIGPRRAVFAPIGNLGLVVVDEEQEWSYKQDERAPRYQGRDVAVELARRAGAVAVLGSATPDVVSMAAALDDDHPEIMLLRLPDRVSGAVADTEGRDGNLARALAPVEVVDLRAELWSGNRGIFSRSLRAAAEDALDAGGQVILFVNRRGAGSAIQCRSCGHALTCSRCSVSLTYHSDGSVVCHQCGRKHRGGVPTACPVCRRSTIRPLGVGTERVEAEAIKAFPNSKVSRWDRDAVRRAGGHTQILGAFIRREVDILVGTQMLAKGLDLPHVTLVGVVNADIGLHSPNLRSAERSFQLLCQVAGRAGRGSAPGRVVIQTYEPDHYAVRAAAAQDYEQFYREEIAFRRALGYPPFARMARLVYRHHTARVAAEESEQFTEYLRSEIRRRGLEGTRLMGPSPAPVERLRGLYRWQIDVLAPDPTELLGQSVLPQGWIVDVDPLNVL